MGSIPGLWRSPGEGNAYSSQYSGLENTSPWGHKKSDTAERLSLSYIYVSKPGFPGVRVVKNLPANLGDTRGTGSIPGLGRSPGGENGSLLLYSCLENPVDRGAWRATVHGVAKSWTWQSNWAPPPYTSNLQKHRTLCEHLGKACNFGMESSILNFSF